MMECLELFAGSRSFGKVAQSLGHSVFSVDINNFKDIDLVKDIEFLTKRDIPFIPDMIWASPPCTTYSIAAISYHRDMGKPTDIWSNHLFSLFNNKGWKSRTECFNGNKNCHHQASPRGSKTGTQGLKNNYERSRIPPQLIKEIIQSIK